MKNANSKMDRRSFLETVSAAGAVAAAGIAGSTSLAIAEHVGEAQWDEEHDVVVVGAGAAGFMAAFAAQEQGADVVLLEKTGAPGGDTAVSEQAILGLWPRKREEVDGQVDDIDKFFADWEKSHVWSNKGRAGEELPAEYKHARRLELTIPILFDSGPGA